MMMPPVCWKRQCKYYEGVDQPDGTEMTERCVCLAFPEGIPDIILSGKDLHAVPLAGQGNTIVFEKE
jgi:hypothetical protein